MSDNLKDHEFLSIACQAIRGGWQIPESAYAELPARLLEIALGQNERAAVKAAVVLIAMVGQNAPESTSESYGRVVVYIPSNGRDDPDPDDDSPALVTPTSATLTGDDGKGVDHGTTAE